MFQLCPKGSAPWENFCLASGFRFRFWVLFSILGVTVESNISEHKKLTQIFLQWFTSPRLQHILWSIYSFPDFSFVMEFSKSMELCGTAEHERNARASGEVHMYIPLKVFLLVLLPAFLAFFPRNTLTAWTLQSTLKTLQMFKSREGFLLFSLFFSNRSVTQPSIYSLLHFPVITGAEQLPQQTGMSFGLHALFGYWFS